MTSADNVTSADLTTPVPDVTTQTVDITTSPYDTTDNVLICKDGHHCFDDCPNGTDIRILNVWFGRLKTYEKCVPNMNGTTHHNCYSSILSKKVPFIITIGQVQKMAPELDIRVKK